MTGLIKRLFKGLFMSFGMFCAIPVPYRKWDDSCTNLILVFFPIIGLIIGLLWYCVGLICSLLAIATILKAAIIMIFPFAVTGFLHLDGFMDTSDALLSRRPLEDKLRILKDPHTGAFAVISLTVLFVIWFAAVDASVERVFDLRMLIFIPVISRAFAALSLLLLPTLEQSSYGSFFKKGTTAMHKLIIFFTAIAAITAMAIVTGANGLISAAAEVLLFVLAVVNAKNELGGVSGDISGYALCIAEAAAILAIAL